MHVRAFSCKQFSKLNLGPPPKEKRKRKESIRIRDEEGRREKRIEKGWVRVHGQDAGGRGWEGGEKESSIPVTVVFHLHACEQQ
jgi:hypothetical protein